MLTTITQGTFVSNGASRIIRVPSGSDYFRVINYTALNAHTANKSVEFEWLNGMAVNNGITTYYNAGATALTISSLAAFPGGALPGFTVIDTTKQIPTAAIVTTASSAAAAPVVDTGTTTELNVDQTVIRLSGIAAAPSICGIDYSVTAITPGVDFTLPVHATALPAGAGGAYRVVSYSADPMFYPTNRTVINVSQAVNATVTTSVVHNYTVGNLVRMKVPVVCGMTQLNDVECIVLTVPTAYTFTINVNTTAFTAFQWPLIAVFPNQVAQVVPVGQGGTLPWALSFEDATVNQGYIGMLLGYDVTGAGLNSPAGQNNDVMYWQAGKVANL